MSAALANLKSELSVSCAKMVSAAEKEVAAAQAEVQKRMEELDLRERTVALREVEMDRRERMLQAKEDGHLLPMTPTPARARGGARFSPRLPLNEEEKSDKSDYGLSPVLFSSTRSQEASGQALESFCMPSPSVESELDVEALSCHRLKAVFERPERRTGGPSSTIAATANALQAAVAGSNNVPDGRKPRVTLKDLLRMDEERLSVH
ncbi:unnamed protein product [Effrenium voratum]|uniref:Uncharacterized protein n=1 Tax=Effrenium voratum TaxID=2562239 RepID=A0AA36I1B4_9DINO|nr:unnamed protein product [Effrenium voratum]CAJ1378412.1 unnamed protein product [Effrenium voratum]CAJ1430829.1 unnamed protein product [Effrenium voratum]